MFVTLFMFQIFIARPLYFDRNSYTNTLKKRREYSKKFSTSPPMNPKHCIPKKWNIQQCYSPPCGMYDMLAKLATLLAKKHSICMLLDSGSLLGAVRNNGHLEWDKDTDFAVFSTNLTAIESSLNAMKLKWKYVGKENNGLTNIGQGFGYHVYTEYKQYIDLWLWSKVSDTHVSCVGINNGCEYWYLHNWKKKPPTYNVHYYENIIHIPFGQWLMPSPNHPENILNQKYSRSWKTKCGGWQRGDIPCSRLYKVRLFVCLLHLVEYGTFL